MSTALMARRKRDPKTVAIAKAILEQYDCKNVEDMQDAIKDIFGPMFEAMLQGEMDSHLGYGPNDHGPKNTENRRNGYGNKTLKSTYGDIPVDVPRDREATFEPQSIPQTHKGRERNRGQGIVYVRKRDEPARHCAND